MTANNSPIDQYPLDNPAVNVAYSLAFEQLQALTAMGLTLDEYEVLPGTPDWVDPDNPTLSKCDVIAWYRLSGRMGAVMSTAAARKAKVKR